MNGIVIKPQALRVAPIGSCVSSFATIIPLAKGILLEEATNLLRGAGVDYLIARENSKRLARLGGTEKDLRPIPRRRTAKS